jgi:hypothetical protein
MYLYVTIYHYVQFKMVNKKGLGVMSTKASSLYKNFMLAFRKW